MGLAHPYRHRCVRGRHRCGMLTTAVVEITTSTISGISNCESHSSCSGHSSDVLVVPNGTAIPSVQHAPHAVTYLGLLFAVSSHALWHASVADEDAGITRFWVSHTVLTLWHRRGHSGSKVLATTSQPYKGFRRSPTSLRLTGSCR